MSFPTLDPQQLLVALCVLVPMVLLNIVLLRFYAVRRSGHAAE